MQYPEYIKKYRPKGIIIKRVRGEYYAYYATSKRVSGKAYPVQVIKGLAGKIDENGFHQLSKALVNTKEIKIRECGFTNFLLKFEDLYMLQRAESKKDKRNIYRSMIVYLSNNSYLCDDKKTIIYSSKELTNKFNIGIPNQITAITKLVGYDLKLLEPLKYICLVVIDKRMFESTLTKAQKDLLNTIGIEESYVRTR